MSRWVQPVTLRAPELVLEPLRLSDSADLLAALGSPSDAAEVLQHLRYRMPDLAAARRMVAAALAEPGRLAFVSRLPAGTVVGTTSYDDIDAEVRSLAVGHTWLARDHWRTGLNTVAKLLLLEHAFDTLGAERVVWHTDERNVRSQAAIERLGARREGVLQRHRRRHDGSLRDTVQYAMLREQWPAAAARLRAGRPGQPE